MCRLFAVVLCAAGMIVSVCLCSFAASSPRMRPYAGIGVVQFAASSETVPETEQLPLYEEPGLVRVGALKRSRLAGNDWIFDLPGEPQPFIVSARKGNWLRICHDDAGRDAWLKPDGAGHFLVWDEFLEGRPVHLLPGLKPRYYQLLQRSDGAPAVTVASQQMFTVVRVMDDWALVTEDGQQAGRLRWRDEDGRLLIGVGTRR